MKADLIREAQIAEEFLHELGHPDHFFVQHTDNGLIIGLRDPHPDFEGLDGPDQGSMSSVYRAVETIRSGVRITLKWFDNSKQEVMA